MDKRKILIAAFAVAGARAANASILMVGDPAPPIKVAAWIQGTPVKSGPGGVRVVEFWATWCGPCKESVPYLTELAKKFKGKVTFTGVDAFEGADHVSGNPKLAKLFLKSMGSKMAYNVAVDDQAGTMGKTWLAASLQPGIPTAFVLDKSGAVAWIGSPLNGLKDTLDKIVAGTFDLKKAKAEYATQMEQQLVEQLVDEAVANYQHGKKAEALAEIDKAIVQYPDVKRPLAMLKFHLVVRDDKKSADAIVTKEATDAKEQAPYAYLQYGMMVCGAKDATKDDLAYGLTLAEKALSIAPTNPIVGFESSLIYAKNGNTPKAISLDQDALNNIGNAKPEIQERLKKTIQDKLTELQAKK